MSREAIWLTVVGGAGLVVVLLCIVGWYGYQSHEEQVLIDQVQSSQLMRGERVQSAEEIRQRLRDLESQYGASQSEARAVVRAFR
jgi:hypothetical protein